VPRCTRIADDLLLAYARYMGGLAGFVAMLMRETTAWQRPEAKVSTKALADALGVSTQRVRQMRAQAVELGLVAFEPPDIYRLQGYGSWRRREGEDLVPAFDAEGVEAIRRRAGQRTARADSKAGGHRQAEETLAPQEPQGPLASRPPGPIIAPTHISAGEYLARLEAAGG